MAAIREGCNGYVVKLACSKDGVRTGFFNGFFYSDSDLVLTSGHIFGFGVADKYEAIFYRGTALEQVHELELLHTFQRTFQDSLDSPLSLLTELLSLKRCRPDLGEGDYRIKLGREYCVAEHTRFECKFHIC